MESSQFKLISTKTDDRQSVSIPADIASKYCKQIQRVLDDSNEYFLEIDYDIELIKLVSSYLIRHGLNNPPSQIPKPLPSKNLDLYVDKDDYEFIKDLDETVLVQLIEISTLLDCTELLDLSLAHIATFFIGKTMNEFKKEYDINDFTPEMEEKIKKDYADIFKNTQFEPKIQMDTQNIK